MPRLLSLALEPVSHARESPRAATNEDTTQPDNKNLNLLQVGEAASLTMGWKNRCWPEYLGRSEHRRWKKLYMTPYSSEYHCVVGFISQKLLHILLV